MGDRIVLFDVDEVSYPFYTACVNWMQQHVDEAYLLHAMESPVAIGSAAFRTGIEDNPDDISKILEAIHTFDLSRVTQYKIPQVIGCSDSVERRLVDDFYNSKEFVNAQPIPGAAECFAALRAQGRELRIATSRPAWTRTMTQGWHNEHFYGTFEEFYFSNGHVISDLGAKSKGQISSALGALCIVEDSLHHAYEVLELGGNAILVKKPWNEHQAPIEGCLYVADTIAEVPGCVAQLQNGH
jgi:hypothetical protein